MRRSKFQRTRWESCIKLNSSKMATNSMNILKKRCKLSMWFKSHHKFRHLAVVLVLVLKELSSPKVLDQQVCHKVCHKECHKACMVCHHSWCRWVVVHRWCTWVDQGDHKWCIWDRFQEVNLEAIHHLLVVCLVSYFRHHLEVEPLEVQPALEVHNQEGIHQCLQIYKTF